MRQQLNKIKRYLKEHIADLKTKYKLNDVGVDAHIDLQKIKWHENNKLNRKFGKNERKNKII